MRILKLLLQGFVVLVKHARALPRTASMAVKQRRRQTVLDELEAERLDRIRNPSKYLGKS
jgi:hypothetical protein